MGNNEAAVVRTDAGMLTVWSPASFRAVIDYDSWETQVNERLRNAIRAGELVPVNIGSDGAWAVRVTSSRDGLSDRERTYEVVTSEPYLLVVTGGGVCVSGIEGVGLPADAPLHVSLADGRYCVRSTIVAWEEEPNALAADGTPNDGALPDFVIQIRPEDGTETYRTEEATFDAPE